MASGPGARTAPGAALTVCLSVCLSQALELRKRGFWTLN